jgi:hypothetical protein
MAKYREEGVENINERKRHLNKADAATAQRKREDTYNREVRKYEKELRLNPPGTADYGFVKGLDSIGDAVRSLGKAMGSNTMTSLDDEEQMKARRDVKGYKKGGKVSSASARADGIAQRGKTKGRIV